MNIEIVEFYQSEKNDKTQILRGTLHIYVPEWDMDIRGISVIKNKSRWLFWMPKKAAFDRETNQKTHYPVIGFANSANHKKLVEAIHEKAVPFINNVYGW